MKNKINDLDLDNWKIYLNDISLDAMWLSDNEIKKNSGKFLIPKRDELRNCMGKDFHGLFIPEIPYQFIKRFTKKDDIVLDPFSGSGTTYKVSKLLNRKCYSYDLNPKEDFIKYGDAQTIIPDTNVQLIILHPPYHNIVKYSENKKDGSNLNSIDDFMAWFEKVVINVIKYLDENKFLILVCGNIYANGEEKTLGVWLKDIICKYNFKLKSHIIKDYGETKGGNMGKNYNLNYYRGLKNNYNFFYGDNIFILQKQ